MQPDLQQEEFRDWAIECLEKLLQSQRPRTISLYDGKAVISLTSTITEYHFNHSQDHLIQEGLPFRWVDDQRQTSGTGKVLRCTTSSVEILLKGTNEKIIPRLTVTLDSSRLTTELMKRLYEALPSNSRLVDKMLAYHTGQYESTSTLPACEDFFHAPDNRDLAFIWGPPGTGKTFNLARISSQLIAKGKRVLLLSNTNIAVDQVTLELAKSLGPDPEGIAFRYGYPRDQRLKNCTEYASFLKALSLDQTRKQLREKLYSERTHSSGAQRSQIDSELDEINKQIYADESMLISNAQFVATTLAKATTSPVIHASKSFDTVLYDEVGMALIPQVVFAATLAAQQFIGCGDFRQLPPIAPNVEDLGEDIFSWLGITKEADARRFHELLVPLMEQHRSHPGIASFVSTQMYGGILQTAPEVLEQVSPITDLSPCKGEPLVLVDTSGYAARQLQAPGKSSSHYNILQAILTARVAQSVFTQLPETSQVPGAVAVITPYTFQAQLINSLINADPFMRGRVSCSTVHSFQGSTAEVVIFDVTDSYSKIGTPIKGANANRLINVALTRARGKAIVIAHSDGLLRKIEKGQSTLLLSLLRKLQGTQAHISAEAYLKNDQLRDGEASPSDDLHAFLADIDSAANEIVMCAPSVSFGEHDIGPLVEALEHAMSRGVGITIRGELARHPLVSSLPSATLDATEMFNPLCIIDDRVIWYGSPFFGPNWRSADPLKPLPIIREESPAAARMVKECILARRRVASESGHQSMLNLD